MEYTSPSHIATPVDGYILQAPVCDRGAIALDMGVSALDDGLKVAKELIKSGRGLERMLPKHLPPSFASTPISAERWYALGAAEYVIQHFLTLIPLICLACLVYIPI